jgi:hypothetical protein
MAPFIKTMNGNDKGYLEAIQISVITGLLLAGCFVGSLLAGKYDIHM